MTKMKLQIKIMKFKVLNELFILKIERSIKELDIT